MEKVGLSLKYESSWEKNQRQKSSQTNILVNFSKHRNGYKHWPHELYLFETDFSLLTGVIRIYKLQDWNDLHQPDFFCFKYLSPKLTVIFQNVCVGTFVCIFGGWVDKRHGIQVVVQKTIEGQKLCRYNGVKEKTLMQNNLYKSCKFITEAIVLSWQFVLKSNNIIY